MAADAPLPFHPDLRNVLTRRLASMDRRALPTRDLKRAAVTLTVVPDDAVRACVVLTRRADHLGRHSGQFALPGGRIDAGESVREAALRELREEVHLEREDAHVLGILDDFVTRSGYHMSAVVVWGGADADMTPDPGEVAEIHRVPLSLIADPERRTVSTAGPGTEESPLLALALLDTWVFAPTAALLLQMARLAVHDEVLRVAHYEQPRFAWS